MTEKHQSGRLNATLKNRGFDTSKQGYATSLGFYGGKPKVGENGEAYLDMTSMDPIDIVDRAGDKRVRSTDEHPANASIFRKNTLRVWKNRATGVMETLHLKSKSEEQRAKNALWEANKSKWANKPTATYERFTGKVDENGDPQSETQEMSIAPRSILKTAAEGFKDGYSMRYRGTLDEINNNIIRLGLEDYYGPHKNGIEFKRPEIYTDGVSLLDIVLAKKEGKTPLEDIDQTDAFVKATNYIGDVHKKHGAIGELLLADIQFQKHEGNTVSDPVLGLPDIVWSNATNSDTTRKATDILDFLVNTSFSLRTGGKTPEEIQPILDTIIDTYGDEKVIRAVRALVNPDRKTGKRLTLPGEKRSGLTFVSKWHNSARLGAKKDFASEVRNEVFAATEKYLPPLPARDSQGNVAA